MYNGYLELICRCLSNDIYIELIIMRISYEKITWNDSHDSYVSDL